MLERFSCPRRPTAHPFESPVRRHVTLKSSPPVSGAQCRNTVRTTKKAHCQHSALYILAERKGLEPSASGVTGRRYNRLNYRSGWWAVQDLNLWPPPCKGASLMRVLLYSKAGLLSTVFIHHHFLTHGMAHRSIQIFSTLLTFLVHNGKPVLRWKQRWIISCPSAQAARTARRTCSCSPSGSTAEKTREDLRLCRKTRRKEMADRP